MPLLNQILLQALAETHSSVEAVSPTRAEAFVRQLAQRERFFVTGQGRSGFVARAFAMRLAQLGFETHVVGETTTPALRAGDALIACSGSGETATVCYHAEKAKEFGAAVFVVTARKASRLALGADALLTIPVARSEQLGNARFEQAAWIVFDAIAAALAQLKGIPPAVVWERHANLE